MLNYVHETYLKLENKESVASSIDYSYQYAQKYLQKWRNCNSEYWDKQVRNIKEKIDFSGLLSSYVKLQYSDKYLSINEYKHIIEPKEQCIIIKDSTYCDLKNLTYKKGITLSAILQYVWHKVLSIYGNSKQTVVGVIISGRNLPIDNIENSVGLYINTLPLIVDHESQESSKIIDSIRDIQDNINEINSRSNVSLAGLQSGGERLFNNLFIYENYPNTINKAQINKHNIKFKGGIEKLDYPLAVIAYEAGNELIFKLNYAGELFSEDNIERLLLLTRILLEQIATNAEQGQINVKDLSYLNEAQYKQIVYEWNKTERNYSQDKTVHQLFEEQVEKTPDNIAVVYERQQLTYRELNKRSNRLANYLKQSYAIKPDTLIVVCLDKSEHIMIGILAVLKAVGAYVPIDPDYPDEKIRYILKDTNALLVLTYDKYKKRFKKIMQDSASCILKEQTSTILILDCEEINEKIFNHSSENPKIPMLSSYLSYVIYTSGTTGQSKGTMIEHRSIVNYIYNIQDQLQLSNRNRVDFSSNIGFDFSITTTLGALCHGAQIIIYGNQLQNLQSYKDHLIKNNVDVVKLLPSYFELLVDILPNSKISKVILGGEKLNSQIIEKVHSLHLTKKQKYKLKIYDEYGPTETTVGAYIAEVFSTLSSLSIGKPYYNYKGYILNQNLSPLPIGAVGELYIGGVGLARGYLNRPDLTQEKFIANPFQTAEEKKLGKNERLYNTGDLVRWLPDGNLEYIGRNDFQVKIRGFRIELGEIESALSSYEGVRQSVVLAKEQRNRAADAVEMSSNLVGYYVSDSKLDEEKILSYLETKLPEYMVPRVLIYLEKLPLTINGKLDRKALPEPEFSTGSDSYVAPRSELEIKICHIWAEVLGLSTDKVGINDDFFRLGGNSILAIKLINALNCTLYYKIGIQEILKYRTVKDFVIWLNIENEKKDYGMQQYEF